MALGGRWRSLPTTCASLGYVSLVRPHTTSCLICAVTLLLGLALAAGCASGPRPLQLLAGADPAYPAAARAAGIEGQVSVSYDVTAAGRVANAVVVAAEPDGVFEAAALATVRSWRFRPATERGVPVAVPRQVSVLRFRLGDDGYGTLPQPRQAE